MEFQLEGRPLIKTFFEKITDEQLRMLECGSPDKATKIVLAELILGMIRSVTGDVLTVLKKFYNMEDIDPPSMDKVTSQISSRALGISDQVDSVSSRNLSGLVAEEVRKNVDSALSNGIHNFSYAANQSVTQPHRLSTMVLHATRVMRDLSVTMKTINAPQQGKPNEKNLVLEDMQLSDGLKDELGLYDTTWSKISTSEGQKTPERDLQSESPSKIPVWLQEDMSKDLSEILTPLLDDLPEDEFRKLHSEIRQELEILSEEVGQIVCSKDKDIIQRARLMIKEFLAKSFAKVWIHRFLIQLKKKHQQYSNIDSSVLVESLVAAFTSLIRQEAEEEENKDSLTLLFKRLSSSTILTFTKQLSDLIYPHFLPQTIPDSASKDSQNVTEVEATYADTYADIQSKVWVFVVLLNWWLKTQGKTLTEKVNMPTTDETGPLLLSSADGSLVNCKVQLRASDTPRYEDGQQDVELVLERKSMLVKLLIEKVFWEIYCDVKMLPEKKDDMTNRLFDRIWAEVHQVELFVTVKNLKSMSMKIYKQLCKMWASADQLLCLVIAQDPNTEIYIASVFKGHLTSPTAKPGYLRSLLSSLGRAVTRPFRNTDKTHIPFFEMLSS